MSKQLFHAMFLLFWMFAAVGCGNKGPLFLPADPQLAQELETVSEKLNSSVTIEAEDNNPNKKKQPANKP